MNNLRGLVLITAQSIRQSFRGKRALALLFVFGLPILAAFLTPPTRANLSGFLSVSLLGFAQFAVPFAGLALGVAVMGDELEGRTITYMFTRPVSRAAVFLGKYFGFVLGFGVVIAVAMYLCTMPYDKQVDFTKTQLLGLMATSVGAFAVYAAMFAALRALFTRALYVGFFWIFVFELIVSKMPASGLTKMSVWHHVAVIEMGLFEGRSFFMQELQRGFARDETWQGSVLSLTVAFVVALAFGSWIVSRREMPVPAAVA